jgi:opacity protein-like surface antigen
VTVLVGGGVEGYTGGFAPQINPGPTWGVGVALKPVGALGLELGYSGATNNLEERAALTRDADIVRNGGSAIGTIGLAPARFQPYLLGGIGFDRYNVRNASASSNFHDDTLGNVPLGLGFRTHVGHFTADARGVYGLLFNQGFAPGGNTDLGDIGDHTPDGRFQAQVRLGATF